jgi:hypothetical protein
MTGPCAAQMDLEDGAVRRACLHEHVADLFVCAVHEERGARGEGFCIPCYEIDGHRCPIRLQPVPA